MKRNPVRDLLFLCAISWAPVAFAAPVDPPAGPPGPPAVPQATVVVDCDAGETLADALATRADVLTVEFTGTCAEELVITRDRLTIRGLDPSATVVDDPATGSATSIFLLQGADVVFEDFTVDGGTSRGVRLQRSSGVQMRNMTVTHSANTGVTVEEASSAHVIDSTFNDNGFAGISAWDSSSVALTGSLEVSGNGVAGVLITGSTFNNRGGQVIVAEDQFFGVGTQHGGSGLFPPVQAQGNLVGAFTFGGSYLGPVTVSGSTIGVLVSNRGTFDGPVDLSTAEGVRIIDNSNAFLRGGPVSAPLAVNGSFHSTLETTGVSFDGDLVFEFGSRAFFATSTTTGAVLCHPTALVGGSLSCSAPLPVAGTQSFGGSAGAPVDLPYPLPLVEPD